MESSRVGDHLHVVHELSADSAILMRGAHGQAGQLGLALLWIGVQRHASHGIAVDFEHVVLIDLFFDPGPRAFEQLFVFDGRGN